MQKRKFAVGLECKRILQWAVSKQLPITVTANQEDNWQLYKSQLLSCHENRLFLTWPMDSGSQSGLQILPGQGLAVTFKKGYNKCFFMTRVIGPRACPPANEQASSDTDQQQTEAMVIQFPEQIEKIQRRSFDRTKLGCEEWIQTTFQSIDRKNVSYKGHITDLSAGGIGVMACDIDKNDFQENAIFHLAFTSPFDHEPINLDVRFRHLSEKNEADCFVLGFQIVGLEMSESGRTTLRRLGKLVSYYQRQAPFKKPLNV